MKKMKNIAPSGEMPKWVEEDTEKPLTDDMIISKLRTMAHWTTEQPWTAIADRFEQLIKEQK